VSAIEEIPIQLGQSLGLGALAWSAQGTLLLELDTGELIGLERLDRDERLLLYLARAILVGQDAGQVLLKALALCHYRQGYRFPIFAGLGAGDRLIFSVKLPVSEATLPVLEERFELLRRLLQEAFGE